LTAPGYCELHAHSWFSLLDGVPAPEQLVDRAAELGLPAIALTDHDALYGAPPFFARAKAAGIKPILGAEITLEDDSHLTLLAENQTGYQHLCQIITNGRLLCEKGSAAVPWSVVAEYASGLICLTGCRRGRLAQWAAVRNRDEAWHELVRLVRLFGKRNVYVELQRNLHRGDVWLTRRLANLAVSAGMQCVATGNVHYLRRDDADLQSVLVSIRERMPLPHMGRALGRASRLRPNFEYRLRSPAATQRLYPDLPDAVATTLEVADRCNVELPSGLQVLPEFPTPRGLDALGYLRHLCQQRLPDAYPRQHAHTRELLDKELQLIAQLGLANYFLIVWDIIEYGRQRGILIHGRGSAANSLVAHLLGISAVDPIAQKLVVERFINVESGGTPDIDLDIDAAKRETVIQYVYDRWGRNHAAMACTYSTYRTRSALRDAGYALGFKPDIIAYILRTVERPSDLQQSETVAEDKDADESIPDTIGTHLPAKVRPDEWQRLVSIAERLRGRPRHLGLHNAGMVLTGQSIADRVPIEPASMPGRTVVQWDKEHLEQQGIVKIDLLGLRMLSAIADTVMLVEREHRVKIDLHALDFGEKAVYDRICSARTIGIFRSKPSHEPPLEFLRSTSRI
jgi:error-prone DNA polymerase